MSNPNVANTILKQLGGPGRIMAMTGAESFIYDFESVQFKFSNRQRNKPNFCHVTYNQDQDLYTVKFGRSGRQFYADISSFEGIHADMLVNLFEEQTGLYLSL